MGCAQSRSSYPCINTAHRDIETLKSDFSNTQSKVNFNIQQTEEILKELRLIREAYRQSGLDVKDGIEEELNSNRLKSEQTLNEISEDVKKNLERIQEEIELTKQQMAEVSEKVYVDKLKLEFELGQRAANTPAEGIRGNSVEGVRNLVVDPFNQLFMAPAEYLFAGLGLDYEHNDIEVDASRYNSTKDRVWRDGQHGYDSMYGFSGGAPSAYNSEFSEDVLESQNEVEYQQRVRLATSTPVNEQIQTNVKTLRPATSAAAATGLPVTYTTVLSKAGTLVLKIPKVQHLGVIVRRTYEREVGGRRIPRMVVRGFRVVVDGEANPCKAAGMETGDVIEQINGLYADSPKELLKMLQDAKGNVTITVYRGPPVGPLGKTVAAVTAQESGLPKVELIRIKNEGAAAGGLGLHLRQIPDKVDKNGKTVCARVLVVGLTEFHDGKVNPARVAGVRVGDIIEGVNGQTAVDAQHLAHMLKSAQQRPGEVLLSVSAHVFHE